MDPAHTLSVANSFLSSKGASVLHICSCPKGRVTISPQRFHLLYKSCPAPASLSGRLHSPFHQLKKYHLLVAPFLPLIQPGMSPQRPLSLPRSSRFALEISALNSAVPEIPLSISGRQLACFLSLG